MSTKGAGHGYAVIQVPKSMAKIIEAVFLKKGCKGGSGGGS